MTLHDILASMGINPSVLMAGTAGGLLRAMSRKRFKFREMIAAPICGALAAAYLTEPAIHYLDAINWPLPPSDNMQATQNATAFLIGVVAMWVADICLDVLVKRLGISKPEGDE
jgi:hypothetical protein